MSRSLRRGAIAALVLAAIVPLSACAAGNTPDTLEVKPDNAATSLGNNLRLNNIVVVTPARSAAGAGESTTGPANVTVNISNTGQAPTLLKSVTVGGVAATFTDAKGAPVDAIDIPAGGAVLIGGPDQPGAHVAAAKLATGGFVTTNFAFAGPGEVSAEAAVQPAVGLYAGFGPKAEALPSASAVAPAPSPSGSASASASATAPVPPSGSASASATGSATATGTPAGTASSSAAAGH
ncbi:DUF461 domain-containing protein [Kitasatospora sp. NPDC088346]|uniref:DUF461 domain-containing protein n=1 Tax=Kitasatospora sp. NPDC088346 TaxID=3364073 RepID=UPI003803EE16